MKVSHGKSEAPSIEVQKEYYDSLWSTRGKGLLCMDDVARRDFVISAVKKVRARIGHELKIIDLGCGPGWLTEALSKYGEVVGMDLSVDAARTFYPNLEFRAGDIITEQIGGHYDIVVSSEVVEHLTWEDQVTYMKKVHQLLNGDGRLILTTPNKPNAEKNLKLSVFDPAYLQPIENWLSVKSLKALLNPYFKVEFLGSVLFYWLFMGRRRLHWGYLNFYQRQSRLAERLLRLTRAGYYLVAVAKRRT
ncbi:class I SAM-dependent methyltransferase [Chloroflexota bacterium]